MKPSLRRIVEFRTPPETEKPAEYQRSALGKVLAGAGAAATVGGFYAYARTRPSAKKQRFYQLLHEARQRRAAATQRTTVQPAASASVPPVVPAPRPKASPANQPVSVKPKATPRVKSKVQIASEEIAKKDRLRKIAESRTLKNTVGVRRGMAARLALVRFQDRLSNGTFGVSTSPLSAYRKASRITPWVNRAGEAAGDIGDMAAGKKVERPFYTKPWFKRAALTAAIGVPLLANSLATSGQQKKRDGQKPRTGNTVGARMDRLTHRMAEGKEKLRQKTGLSARRNPLLVAMAAHERLVRLAQFAYADALEKGWDVRDARGRSARVYAPGSRKRDRREKTWGEKTDNIRRIRNIAIAGTVAGAGATGYLAYRNAALRRQIKTARPAGAAVADNIIRGVKFA
ncbi:hypothetical protein OpiT1DRAFT_05623 [Opitutaceae bacterium TAV1]|nr:hypothetical protein OpiT1DRAFT_05623 [Opitutaceae bacterium TAV1]